MHMFSIAVIRENQTPHGKYKCFKMLPVGLDREKEKRSEASRTGLPACPRRAALSGPIIHGSWHRLKEFNSNGPAFSEYLLSIRARDGEIPR